MHTQLCFVFKSIYIPFLLGFTTTELNIFNKSIQPTPAVGFLLSTIKQKHHKDNKKIIYLLHLITF